MKNNELKQAWRDICEEYLRLFCEKHDFDFDPEAWVGIDNDPGTVICINDMFVDMENLRYDIDNDIDAGIFESWYWTNLDREEKGLKYMNYPSFIKGAPDPYTKEQLELIDSLIEEARAAKRKAVEEIEKAGGKPNRCLMLL